MIDKEFTSITTLKKKIISVEEIGSRAETLISQASEDTKGRKVRYYREMSQDQLDALIKEGQMDCFDRFAKDGDSVSRKESAKSPPDSSSLYTLLNRHATQNLHFTYEQFKEIVDLSRINDIVSNPEYRERVLKKFFPDADETEIMALVQNWSYETFIPFLEHQLPEDFLKRMHTGSLLQKYSPYLSASVGGPVLGIRGENRVVVEMIISDDEVIVNEYGITGEKEVFVRSLKKERIARVFTSNEQLRTEVLENPQTQIGEYFQNTFSKLSKEEQDSTTLLETWRWNEPTTECLPVSKAKVYVHKGK